jgi:hypothetical protein
MNGRARNVSGYFGCRPDGRQNRMPAASTGAASQLRPSATRFHGPEPIEQAIFEPRQSMLQPPNPRGGRLDYSLESGDPGGLGPRFRGDDGGGTGVWAERRNVTDSGHPYQNQ